MASTFSNLAAGRGPVTLQVGGGGEEREKGKKKGKVPATPQPRFERIPTEEGKGGRKGEASLYSPRPSFLAHLPVVPTLMGEGEKKGKEKKKRVKQEA